MALHATRCTGRSLLWRRGSCLSLTDALRRICAGRSVAGQQFIIEDCEDCDLYIFDDNAAVTIDECKNCRIFIGPCDSSIFIRDCYNCKLVFFCRQFRCVASPHPRRLLPCEAPTTRPDELTPLGLAYHRTEIRRPAQ